MANECKECGCSCNECNDNDVHLHVEIENLKQKLVERENHIVTMETNFLNEANKFPNGELGALKEELLTWQDKYKRLYEAHRRVQRVNQGLEDKLLRLVDVCETEKSTLTKDIASLSQKLAEANYAVKKLTEDNERYKSDVALAIQFLQCKQSNFVSHKFESLPQEVQTQVSSYMTIKKKPEEKKGASEAKSIKVPIPTFPPTAMVYSVSKNANTDKKLQEDPETPEVDIVSAAIMAKVLEERQRERACIKHCDTCTCSKNLKIIYDSTHHSISTQTTSPKSVLCSKCNEMLQQVQNPSVRVIRESSILKMPVYINDSNENIQNNHSNVVKVQPNNFLNDDSSKNNLIDLHTVTSPQKNVPKASSVCNDLIEKRKSVVRTASNRVVYETGLKVAQKSKSSIVTKHHRLCRKNSATCEPDPGEKGDCEKEVEKEVKLENPKGPRYCAMRVENGSRNILLDNVHSNVAPVLYTRQHKAKQEKPPHSHGNSHTESTCSEEPHSSLLGSDSVHNEQRVADWIQNNLDNDLISSDTSRSDSVKNITELDSNMNAEKHINHVDKAKYAEMEENVKRFLFGESEFMKTVELGKLKYKMIRENEKATCHDSTGSAFTETQI